MVPLTQELTLRPHRQLHAPDRALPPGRLQTPLSHNPGVENLSVPSASSRPETLRVSRLLSGAWMLRTGYFLQMPIGEVLAPSILGALGIKVGQKKVN